MADDIRVASALAQVEVVEASQVRVASALAQVEVADPAQARVASGLTQVEVAEPAQGRVASVVVQVEYAEIVSTPVDITCDALVEVTRPTWLETDTWLGISHARSLDADAMLTVRRSILLDTDVLLVIRSAEQYAPTRREEPGLDFLGKGLRFPFAFQRRSGGAQVSTATSSNHAHIHESIRQILGTRKGERLMRPDFGTRLHELVFEPNDQLLYGLLRHEVIEALEQWEPRVIITDVSCGPDETDGHLVLIRMDYRLISSQVEGNLVYPFYRELE